MCSTYIYVCVIFPFLVLECFSVLGSPLLTRIRRSVPFDRLSTSVPSCHMAGMLSARKPVVPVAKARVHLVLRFTRVRPEVRLRSCYKRSLCYSYWALVTTHFTQNGFRIDYSYSDYYYYYCYNNYYVLLLLHVNSSLRRNICSINN